MASNVAAGNQWKHPKFTFSLSKTFILSVKLEYICIGTSLNILVAQNSKAYFRARNMLPRNNADCHGSWKNSVFRLRGRYPIKHSLFEREKEKKSLIHLLDQPPTAP